MIHTRTDGVAGQLTALEQTRHVLRWMFLLTGMSVWAKKNVSQQMSG